MSLFSKMVAALAAFAFAIPAPSLAQTSTTQQVVTTPATWGPTTLNFTTASNTQSVSVPGSGSMLLRITGTCTDTNPASIVFGNSPDTGSTSLGTALLYKAGIGSLGRNSLTCNGAMSGSYRIITGGSQVSITTSSTFSGNLTIVLFASQGDDVILVNGPVHNAEEEALRAGRAWVVSTQLQAVSSGNYLIATLSNPAGSGVNSFIIDRVFACNGATATTPQQWTVYANPTTVPATTVALVNRKPGDTSSLVDVFRWQMGATQLAGGVQADSGVVLTGGGFDSISTMTMITPGTSVGVMLYGAGGGLAATANCKVSYYGYDEPIN